MIIPPAYCMLNTVIPPKLDTPVSWKFFSGTENIHRISIMFNLYKIDTSLTTVGYPNAVLNRTM